MPATLFGDRFYSLRQPAWHGLGQISDTPQRAPEALDAIGDYSVTLEDIAVPSVGLTETNHRMIVRHPVSGDDTFRTFGIVTKDYNLITPRDTAEIWDRATSAYVETMGSLGNGEEFFISTKLPSFKVVDDEIDNYLLAVNPMTGLSSAQVRVTPVRVVCANTLALAKRQSAETFRVIHDAKAHQRFEGWLKDAYARALDKSETIQQAFTLLTGVRVTTPVQEQVLTSAYPDPIPFSTIGPVEVVREREKLYEYNLSFAKKSRGAVTELFEGAGTGLGSEAAAGTLWGLWNSVTEYENYRRSRNDSTRAYKVLFGDRADIMARSFETSLAIAMDEPIPFTVN